MFDWKINSLVEWSILFISLIDKLTVCWLIPKFFIDWSPNKLIDWLNVLIGWLVIFQLFAHWLIDYLIVSTCCMYIDRLIDLPIDQQTDWLIDWLIDYNAAIKQHKMSR